MQPVNRIDKQVYGDDDELMVLTKAEYVRSNLFLLQPLNCGIRFIAQFSDSVDLDKLLKWISDEYLLLTWYEDENYIIFPFDEFRREKIETDGEDPIRWFFDSIYPFKSKKE